MSEETPQSWSSELSAEMLGAPVTDAPVVIRDEGVAGSWILALIGGVLVGIVGAVVAGAVWVGAVVLTERMYTVLAILVGVIVGMAVFLGGRRRKHLGLAVVAVVLTVLALAASEYFIVRHFTIQQLIAEGYKGEVPLLLPLADMVDIVKESLSEEPINLLLWVGACWVAFVIPARGTDVRQR